MRFLAAVVVFYVTLSLLRWYYLSTAPLTQEVPFENCLRSVAVEGRIDFWAEAAQREGLRRVQRQIPLRISLMHIPKTSGVSLYRHFLNNNLTKKLIKFQRSSPGKDENCLQEVWQDGLPVGTMFRQPHAHVYSQFLECTYDNWGKAATKDTAFPRGATHDEAKGITPDFDAWLHHFSQEKAKLTANPLYTVDYFNCYYPDNMQARYLLRWEDRSRQGRKMPHTCHGPALDNTLPISAARELINELWFVGILEHSALSFCIFEFQVRGNVNENCLCGTPDLKMHWESHFVPKHSVKRLKPVTLSLIDNLVSEDVQIYAIAREIFYRRALAVQRRLGVCLTGVEEAAP